MSSMYFFLTPVYLISDEAQLPLTLTCQTFPTLDHHLASDSGNLQTYKVDILMLFRILLEPTLFLCCISIFLLFNSSTIVMTIASGTTAMMMNNKTISISQVSILIPIFLLHLLWCFSNKLPLLILQWSD